MLSATRASFFCLGFSAFFLLTVPHTTHAQCMTALPGLGSVSSMTGNPFEADVQDTVLNANGSGMAASVDPAHNGHVARDSQGRLRTEWSAGKFKIQNGAEQGTEVEQIHVTICDPVKHEWIQLDTLNKTATILPRRTGSPEGSAASPAINLRSFCALQSMVPPGAPENSIEDLGHRNIEGFDAVGYSRKRTMPTRTSPVTGMTIKLLTPTTENWCSEELGANLLRVMGTEERGNTRIYAMVNIQRGEPDPLLFQIPPTYRIVERVHEERPSQGMVSSQGFGGSTPSLSSEEPAPPKP